MHSTAKYQHPSKRSPEHKRSSFKELAKVLKPNSMYKIRSRGPTRKYVGIEPKQDDETEKGLLNSKRTLTSQERGPEIPGQTSQSKGEVVFPRNSGLNTIDIANELAQGGDTELWKLRDHDQTFEDHTDRMQSLTDHSNWIREFQVEDRRIEQEFDSLMEKIITWSRNKDFVADMGVASRLKYPTDPSHRFLLCQVSPWCETEERFEINISRLPRYKTYLLRGLVARVLCEKIFPPNGEDYWLDEDTRSQLRGLEEKLKHGDSTPGYLSRFHHWRALTVNALSMSHRQKVPVDILQDIVNDVYRVLGHEAEDAISSAGALLRILEASVNFSHTLRRQRPYWSIRLPKVKLNNYDIVNAADYDTREMMHRKFDEDNFQRLKSGDPLVEGYVSFFITPALLKRGKGDGQHFEEKDVVYRRAKVKAIVKDSVPKSKTAGNAQDPGR